AAAAAAGMSAEPAAPELAAGPRPRLPTGARRTLVVTLALSGALHLALLVGVTGWFHRVPMPSGPHGTPTVELIMQDRPDVHFGGPPPSAAAAPQPAPAPPRPAAQATPAPPAPPTRAAAHAVPVPPPPPTPPVAEPSRSPENTANAAVHLGDSGFATGLASGKEVIPAAPDAGYRNLPPHYPPEAERRGEQGAVTLLIHVAPTGLASGVDIAE